METEQTPVNQDREQARVSRMSSNIVIDIENEDLSFNQAKQIRLQIEKDVE